MVYDLDLAWSMGIKKLKVETDAKNLFIQIMQIEKDGSRLEVYVGG